LGKKKYENQVQTSKGETATDFQLEIPDDIFQKIMWWINKANFEVSGFGSLDFDEKEKKFTVRDVILIQQEVGPTSTEICPKALGKAMFRMKDEKNGLKWHWHSHVDMGVFWSADDRELIRSLGQKGWILATVFNKKREKKTAFLTQSQVMGRPHDIFVDDVPTYIQKYLDDDLVKALDAEYDLCVKQKTYPTYVRPDYGDELPGFYGHGGLYGGYGVSKWEKPLPIPASSYDVNGFTMVDKEWVYNPCFDTTLAGVEARFSMITEMEPEEVSFLRARCGLFDKLVRDYYLFQATEPLPTVDLTQSEAEWEGMEV
jgi:hypothetical protein